jgi:hypothetical protein
LKGNFEGDIGHASFCILGEAFVGSGEGFPRVCHVPSYRVPTTRGRQDRAAPEGPGLAASARRWRKMQDSTRTKCRRLSRAGSPQARDRQAVMRVRTAKYACSASSSTWASASSSTGHMNNGRMPPRPAMLFPHTSAAQDVLDANLLLFACELVPTAALDNAAAYKHLQHRLQRTRRQCYDQSNKGA